MFPPFQAHALVPGGHLQTILGCYLPGVRLQTPATQQHVRLPDGDLIVLHENAPPQWRPGDRAALLVHGLGGSHRSGYMVRGAAKLYSLGVRVFRMDLRGCGAGADLAKHPIHAGRSEDISAALDQVMENCPNSPVALAGYSMGANLALKFVGELGALAPACLQSVMAVSPPIDLIQCSENMGRGLSRYYDQTFVRGLLRAARRRRLSHPEATHPSLSPIPKSLREFDQLFTAPLGGFRDADDYYTRASSGKVLKQIAVPTLIVAAADDPIIPVESFERADYSASTTLLIAAGGGHLGFIGRGGVDPDRRWLDWRLVEWVFRDHAPPPAPHSDPLASKRAVVVFP